MTKLERFREFYKNIGDASKKEHAFIEKHFDEYRAWAKAFKNKKKFVGVNKYGRSTRTFVVRV